MIYKLIGAAMLMALSISMAFQICTMESRRVRQTEALLLLLRYIKAQISCFRTPLSEMFAGFENEELEACGLLPLLRDGCSFPDAFEKTRPRLYLDSDETEMLSSFSREIGGGYREEQEECCAYYIRELERAYSEGREERPARVRVLRSLVISAGLMVIIILV